jgi:hypothetical protein
VLVSSVGESVVSVNMYSAPHTPKERLEMELRWQLFLRLAKTLDLEVTWA